MVETRCLAHDDPNRIYDYCPSFAAAILFTILFTTTTVYHTYQAFFYRKGFSWVIIMAGSWELAGYACRTLSVTRQDNSGIFTAQQLLILLAPLWINAFIYMTLGRLLHFCLENDRVLRFRARRITVIFILFDVTAFLVQAAGGIMTSGTETPVSTINIGLKIYTAGIGLQLAFMAFFCIIAVKFQTLLKRQDAGSTRTYAMEATSESTVYKAGTQTTTDLDIDFRQRSFLSIRPLLIVIWAALALIFLRNIYRLAEWGIGGVHGNTITRHEWWIYVFDAVPMFVAMVLFNLYHPGRALQGPRCDFKTEDKARKTEKKQLKQIKRAAKKQKKAGYQGTGSSDIAENLV